MGQRRDLAVSMAESSDEDQRRKMPEGILQPGRLTTTSDPEMRKRAERILQEHRENEQGNEDVDG